ncbi:MAG TPA: hypothetical protein VGO00_08850 [Kofleriaceae bacterium]|jgi:hypothetical protein|nr:hypothetical protein [Kofleriaceae bacterium]
MIFRFSSAPILLAFLTSVPLVACTSDPGPSTDATITIDNQESFAITDIYIDDVGNDTLSDNVLGNVPLQPGDQIIVNVSCSTYDVTMIDETDVTCAVHSVDLCANDAVLVINDAFCDFSGFRDSKKTSFKVPVSK